MDRTIVTNDTYKRADYADDAARIAEKLGLDKEVKEFRRLRAEAVQRCMNAPVYQLIALVLMFATGVIGMVLLSRCVLF